jgi:hypothetical protein
MPPRKTDPRIQFTPDDIVRAIEGVEKAGLDIYSVEITLKGDIRVTTGPRSKKAATEPRMEKSDAVPDSSADTHFQAKALKK